MPLSEHEQRLLEQMERALIAEDPKFATSLRHGTTGADRRKIAIGVVGLIAGIALMLVGVASQIAPLGIVGFLVMLAACVVGVSALRGKAPRTAEGTAAGPATPPPAGKKSRSSGGFMGRMEQRWQDRNRGNGREQ